MEFDTNNHSFFLLQYHLVMCTNHCQQVIDNDISERLKEIFEHIAPKYNITLDEWTHELDYVYIIFKGHPNTELSRFLNAYKSASSRLIKKEFPRIREFLWNDLFWEQSNFIMSAGNISMDIIDGSIQFQRNKWQTKKNVSNKKEPDVSVERNES